MFKKLLSLFPKPTVLKIYAIPAVPWRDRDSVMFHAVFQILVDFVELEQPFTRWDSKNPEVTRFTDRAAMAATIEEFKAEIEPYGITGQSDLEQYNANREIFFLYCWYCDKRYDLDTVALDDKTATEMNDGRIAFIHSNRPRLITMREAVDIETEHELLCEVMLHRVIAIRPRLWT